MWNLSHICDLHCRSQQRLILNPLSEARDQIRVLMYIHWVISCWATTGTPRLSISQLSTMRHPLAESMPKQGAITSWGSQRLWKGAHLSEMSAFWGMLWGKGQRDTLTSILYHGSQRFPLITGLLASLCEFWTAVPSPLPWFICPSPTMTTLAAHPRHTYLTQTDSPPYLILVHRDWSKRWMN